MVSDSAQREETSSSRSSKHGWDIRTATLPEDMRFLLADYPRDSWECHPGFKNKTRQWLGAHTMFRQTSAILKKDVEVYLDGEKDPHDYMRRLAYRGGSLVNNLHGHHGWEDNSFFPELSAADARFDRGLAILEKDHAALEQVLHDFSESANRFIRLVQSDNSVVDVQGKMRSTAGHVHAASDAIEALLLRHLGDEEELAVPIILHHRLRG